MAKATTTIIPANNPQAHTEEALERLTSTLAKEETAVVQLLELVRDLAQRGLLQGGSAILQQSPDILRILLGKAEHPEGINAVQNLIGLVALVGTLDNAAVARAVDVLVRTTETAKTLPPVRVNSVWDLAGALRDDDIKRGIGAGLTLLKALGQSLDRPGEPHA